jgi:RNA polymerase sigma-70 factor (ECF subfamily)
MIALYLSLIEEEEQKNKFEKLYYKYRNLMYYIAEGVLHHSKDSEDAVQEALIRVAKNMDKIGEIESTATKNFLGIITKREAMKLYDKRKRYAEITEADLSMEEDGKEIRFFDTYAGGQKDIPINEVAQALEALPYKYSSLMTLKYVMGYSGKEISEIAGMTESNVRQQLFQGRKLLEKMLAQ